MSHADPDPQIREIAGRQGGHVTREQLYELGMSRRAVEHRLARGRIVRVYHGVYAVGCSSGSPIDAAHAALLAAGERSVLAGRTALAVWQAERTWAAPLELLTPTDKRVSGLTLHRSGTLLPRDIRGVQGLRVTSPARTALDLAAHAGERDLTRVANELRHRNGLTLAQLRDVVGRNPRHPGAQRLRQLIGESQDQPTRSELENAFLRMLRRYGLPIPLINVALGGRRVDAYFPDHRLIVELDGALTHAHDWRPAFESDRARDVEVMLRTGLPVIHFTCLQVKRHHRDTSAKLRAILRARAP